MIVGAKRLTRRSLTSVAVVPAGSDIEKPASTTCATSWIVAPIICPARVSPTSNCCRSAGYNIIATVDSAVTLTIVINNCFSECSDFGSTDEIANAADAPQIETAPAVRMEKCLSSPSARPTKTPIAIVASSPKTTTKTACHPSAVTTSTLIRAPSNIMPNFKIVPAENSIPGRTLGSVS